MALAASHWMPVEAQADTDAFHGLFPPTNFHLQPWAKLCIETVRAQLALRASSVTSVDHRVASPCR